MGKEVSWLYAPCVVSILKYLAILPRTPMRLRMLAKIRGNYANLILKRLEEEEIVKCLTPHEKIGKVFCINPLRKDLVEKVLKASGYNLRVRVLPELNWKAYGKLNCKTCKQIKKVFNKISSMANLGKTINEQNLEIEFRNARGVLEIDRSDIYRASRQLRNLGLIAFVKKKHKPLEYELTKDAIALVEFIKSQ